MHMLQLWLQQVVTVTNAAVTVTVVTGTVKIFINHNFSCDGYSS